HRHLPPFPTRRSSDLGWPFPRRRPPISPPAPSQAARFTELETAAIRVKAGDFYRKTGKVMQVRLLGPVDVMVDGEPRPVRGLRRSEEHTSELQSLAYL